ncbi:MAG TPA: diacylglycerol kinase family protein [Nocardioidaceae bacterium]|nr:diacylglycerol kinase family protein [Nocardioidaceae bacterium]
MSFTAATHRRFLIWGSVSLVVLMLLCVGAWQDSDLLDELDGWLELGHGWWRGENAWLEDPLLWVSDAFNTIPMAAASLVAAGLLGFKKYFRAAGFVVIVMASTITVSYLLKAVVARPRRVLEDPILVIENHALPSGHAAYMAAAAGIAMVLATMFLRKRVLRRLVGVVGTALALLVGLDRLMLEVHTPTDVVAGYALGAAAVLWTAYFFDPAPPLISAEPLASPVLVDKKLACILNPIKVEDIGAFQDLVNGMAKDAGYLNPDWYFTEIEDPGRSMAEQAAISGASLVLVCGGDGTVRTVCGELAGTGVPVGVIPAGTGNLLARNLDLPLYIRSAIDVGLNGQDRAVDIVHISGDGLDEQEHFLVMAGMGFDAAIMEGVNEQLKEKVGFLAYFVSGLRNLMFPAVRVEVSVDDGPWTKHRARTIVVGNVGNLQGGLPLLPDAAIDDGTIDLVMLNPRRFLSWLRIVARVLRRSPLSDETVTRMSGRKIAVRASAPTPRQIDGDSIGPGSELVCEVLAGKLLLRAPR